MSPANSPLSATLPRDLTDGLVVFLVAVPLCLGIALASGAPLLSGVLAGIVGGILERFWFMSLHSPRTRSAAYIRRV